MATESVEVGLARLEGSYAQTNERLSSIEARLGSLEQKTDRHFELLIGRMDRQFFWLIWVLLTSLAGLVTSLLTLFIRQ